MASSRVINTGFWKDRYVVDLETDERLLFLYLLTNPQTNIAGIYEISIREMVFDTTIDEPRILEILQKFIKDKKIYYQDGWVALVNWTKHQAKNPKVLTGIQRIVENLPDWLKSELLGPEKDAQNTLFDDSLSIGHERLPIANNGQVISEYSLSKPIALNLTKLNLTKPNANVAEDSEKGKFKGSENWTPKQKRDYALAMEREREQKRKADDAATRDPGTAERLRHRIETMKNGGSTNAK